MTIDIHNYMKKTIKSSIQQSRSILKQIYYLKNTPTLLVMRQHPLMYKC